METKITTDERTAAPAKEKGKTSFGKKFLNFLMYGGFIVILILGMVGFIVISKLTS